jgi:hypothetical protein
MSLSGTTLKDMDTPHISNVTPILSCLTSGATTIVPTFPAARTVISCRQRGTRTVQIPGFLPRVTPRTISYTFFRTYTIFVPSLTPQQMYIIFFFLSSVRHIAPGQILFDENQSCRRVPGLSAESKRGELIFPMKLPSNTAWWCGCVVAGFYWCVLCPPVYSLFLGLENSPLKSNLSNNLSTCRLTSPSPLPRRLLMKV